jgi:ERCC4-type nuclease
MQIIVDSREQRPYFFKKYDAEIISGTLETGDYSISGFEDRISIERKSIDDIINCLSHDRNRFERELMRGSKMESFIVVMEASLDDIARGRYRSRMLPHAALQSIVAFQTRYKIPFVFAGYRSAGEYITYSFLEKFIMSKGAVNGKKNGKRCG